jgi:hypothetical protein
MSLTKFERVAMPPEQDDPAWWVEHRGLSPEQAAGVVARQATQTMWLNNVFQVAAYDCGELVHLSIKRRDRRLVRDWRLLQWIKNELVGPECEAVELFPAESRLVDGADQWHLWVVKDPAFRFPFGFSDRLVRDDGPGMPNTTQRPRRSELRASADER